MFSKEKINELVEQVNQYNDNPKSFLEPQVLYVQLRDIIKEANIAYYENSNPFLDDTTYDILFQTLKDLKDNARSLGVVVLEEEYLGRSEGEVEHYAPMLSLQKIKDKKGLETFFESMKKNFPENENLLYSIEPKFDGLSIELIYKNGKLVDAVTRGDGKKGMSVIQAINYIPSIPKALKQPNININLDGIVSVRGEIILPLSNFEQVSEGEESNPRNLASGIIRTLKPNKNKCEALLCYVYDILYVEQDKVENFGTQALVKETLKEMGFLVHPLKNVWTSETLIEMLLDQQNADWLQEQDIELDGYVIKLNDIAMGLSLGYTGHHPRSAFAFKYQGEQVTTLLQGVTWQVGKTGILTPVAELKEVAVGGVMVKRATLHNMDFIRAKNLHINNHIFLQRSGDVIPYIVGVNQSKENTNLKAIEYPKECPICQGKIVVEHSSNGLQKILCSNSQCPSKMVGKILQVVGKNAFDIDGFGIELVSEIVKLQIINSPCEILHLEKYSSKLLAMRGFGDKKYINLKKGIQELIKKGITLESLLVALNIPNVSKGVAKILVDGMLEGNSTELSLDTITYWLSDKKNYISLYGIGDILANDIYLKTQSLEFAIDMIALKELNLPLLLPRRSSNNENAFHFSLTGKFSQSRGELVKQLENIGGIYHETPNKKCEVVFVGGDAGSKEAKAKKLNLNILYGDEELKKYIEEKTSLNI